MCGYLKQSGSCALRGGNKSEIAAGWLEADDKHLENAIGKGFLQEVNYGNGK